MILSSSMVRSSAAALILSRECLNRLPQILPVGEILTGCKSFPLARHTCLSFQSEIQLFVQLSRLALFMVRITSPLVAHWDFSSAYSVTS